MCNIVSEMKHPFQNRSLHRLPNHLLLYTQCRQVMVRGRPQVYCADERPRLELWQHLSKKSTLCNLTAARFSRVRPLSAQ